MRPSVRRDGGYRGRLAPSPTGYLHAGHALTFWRAQERCRDQKGTLLLRIEDLDRERCRPEFREALYEDLRWFGLRWAEDPILQSDRQELYLGVWRKLRERDLIYPCDCSRRDVLSAAGAPHLDDEEPIYPGTCRPQHLTRPVDQEVDGFKPSSSALSSAAPTGRNWRFRVPLDEEIQFFDHCSGPQRAVAGRDFGDFLIWRKDNIPAYQLAVVVDDAEQRVTEVVRGADLLGSTFRQLLLYRALGLAAPEFCHVPLIRDSFGKRLAKRHDSLSLRTLRAEGVTPEQIRERFAPMWEPRS